MENITNQKCQRRVAMLRWRNVDTRSLESVQPGGACVFSQIVSNWRSTNRFATPIIPLPNVQKLLSSSPIYLIIVPQNLARTIQFHLELPLINCSPHASIGQNKFYLPHHLRLVKTAFFSFASPWSTSASSSRLNLSIAVIEAFAVDRLGSRGTLMVSRKYSSMSIK